MSRLTQMISLHLAQAEVAAVTRHEVARAPFKFRRDAHIAFALDMDAKYLKANVLEATGGLDPGIAYLVLTVGHAGEGIKELARQLNDRSLMIINSVLHCLLNQIQPHLQHLLR